MAGLLDGLSKEQQAGLLSGLAELYKGLEQNPAHPPERFNRGVRNTAKAIVGGVLGIPQKAFGISEAWRGGERTPEVAGEMGTVALDVMAGGAPMAVKGAVGAAGGALKGIRAYHGSPHDFDRFDMSKIGTGEGAQAYGHGLYFAENEGVARQYRNALEGKHHIQANDANAWALGLLKAHGDDPARAIADIRGRLARAEDANSLAHSPQMAGKLKAAIELIEGGGVRRGKMYEVNINAAPEQFLDWDRPLAQQPGVVQDLARNADLSHLGEGNRTRVMLEKFKRGEEQPHYLATGHTLHNALEDYGMKPRPELSAYLKDQGIPGIKYLEQGSRFDPAKIQNQIYDLEAQVVVATDDKTKASLLRQIDSLRNRSQTNNYVVFDDKLIDILKKYGLLGGMTGGSGLLASGDEQ
jgi:hypothetical protein